MPFGSRSSHSPLSGVEYCCNKVETRVNKKGFHVRYSIYSSQGSIEERVLLSPPFTVEKTEARNMEPTLCSR